MVVKLAEDAGLTADQLYFNIEKVGNTSAASIPLALADAKADGVLTEPVRVFAPATARARSAATPCCASTPPSSPTSAWIPS
jgi:3-oxoacyl-[acyl-carrier-protein] synthase III